MTDLKKTVTVFAPCYNEAENVEELFSRVSAAFSKLKGYDFEMLFIDNHSSDNTLQILKRLAALHKNVKIIANARNFGHVRSPYHGLRECHGDVVIIMASDLQDPPEMIPKFIEEWEKGHALVLAVKTASKEGPFMFFVRKTFYSVIKYISATEQLKNFTGFGLYDQKFIDVIRRIDDPYPYFRGMVMEYGWDIKILEYTQDKRKKGRSSNNFFTLYDIAMLGFVNHSKLPLRLSAFIGFFSAGISLLVALVYFVYKILYWDTFQAGSAPMVIGIFFFSSIQLFFIGIIGEYIGAIHTQVRKRPLVIERERINFDN